VKDAYGFEIDLRSTNTMIVEEIKAGRIDVLMVEQEIATSILELNTTLSTVGIATSLDLETGNAIAFAKGSIYLEDVNKVLETLKQNGELDRLIAKWFQ
jgi:polar amino acid transport system substrate-binding protein